MRLLHSTSRTRARFDDPNLVSCAGLVPVMRLAQVPVYMNELQVEKALSTCRLHPVPRPPPSFTERTRLPALLAAAPRPRTTPTADRDPRQPARPHRRSPPARLARRGRRPADQPHRRPRETRATRPDRGHHDQHTAWDAQLPADRRTLRPAPRHADLDRRRERPNPATPERSSSSAENPYRWAGRSPCPTRRTRPRRPDPRFRPKRRAHDAIAEIHHFGTRGYRWVVAEPRAAKVAGLRARRCRPR